MNKHVMSVMDRDLGHRTVTWNPTDAAAVADARAQFDALKAQGYTMFKMVALGQHAVVEEQGEEIDEFDPADERMMVRTDRFDAAAERVTAVPQRQGG